MKGQFDVIEFFRCFVQVSNILNIDKALLDSACTEMKIPTSILDAEEYNFLKEYRSALYPVAIGLKNLEANKCTFAAYLPTLIGLRRALGQRLSDSETDESV